MNHEVLSEANLNAGYPDLGKLNFGLSKLLLNLVAILDRKNSMNGESPQRS
jgi:hypothetical protein